MFDNMNHEQRHLLGVAAGSAAASQLGALPPPLPPFTAGTAAQKARIAEDSWNTRDPVKVALAYARARLP
jgi:hypothetical protein